MTAAEAAALLDMGAAEGAGRRVEGAASLWGYGHVRPLVPQPPQNAAAKGTATPRSSRYRARSPPWPACRYGR